jgi:hypothetical protein
MVDVCIFYDNFVYFTVMLSILRSCCLFCGHLVHFVVIWYIFPVLVCCNEKNLANLMYNTEFSYLVLRSQCGLVKKG